MSPLTFSICVMGRDSWSEGTESVKLGKGVLWGTEKSCNIDNDGWYWMAKLLLFHIC